MTEGGEKHKRSKIKIQVQVVTCLLMDDLTNKLRKKYGFKSLKDRVENIHIIDLPLKRDDTEIGELSESAKTTANYESFVNSL